MIGREADPELGLEPEPVDDYVMGIERCGCVVPRSAWHDVPDCLEAQADAAAYQDDLRRGGLWD